MEQSTMNLRLQYLLIIPLLLALVACAGTQTFTPAARAGDTVTLAVGWQKKLVRQNLTVKITGSDNVTTTYLPNDAHVRAIMNLYPDPASYAVVDTATKQSTNGQTIGNLINNYVTPDSTTSEHDNDWWQTSVLLDLPASLPVGTANITLTDSGGASLKPITITIVAGAGSSNLFNIYSPWGSTIPLLDQNYWPYAAKTLEREPNSTVTFANSNTDANGNPIVPHSIQIQFSHTPNVGKTWVVNPRGDIKNVVWRDDGSTITVILTPTQGVTLTQMLDFKFYVSGGVAALTQTSLKAYDVNGVSMTGVTAAIQ